jgi:peptidoglycan/LPS O-acetylase OafA/YrhL
VATTPVARHRAGHDVTVEREAEVPASEAGARTAARAFFPCLDGYRALAAVAVLVLHVTFVSGTIGRNHDLGQFLIRLDVGVSVFFLISGFLLYRPFVLEHLRGRPGPGLRDYFLGRFLRIFPAYWVALIAVVWVFHQSGPQHEINNLGDFISYFGLLQQYTAAHAYGGIQQAWTLCVEVAFYLFLPVWAVGMRAVARRVGDVVRVELLALALLFAVGIGYRMLVLSLNTEGGTELSWLPAFFDQFALGMLLAVVSAGTEAGRMRSRLAEAAGRRPWACWVLAAVGFVAVSTVFDLPLDYSRLDRGQWLAWTLLYGATAFFLLLPGVFGPQERGLVRRFLRHPWVAGLGVVSYGIYLWHELWLERFFHSTDLRLFDANVFAVLGYAGMLSLVAAILSWSFVERPALRLRRGAAAWARGDRVAAP